MIKRTYSRTMTFLCIPGCMAALFLVCSPMAPMVPFEQIESSRIRPVGMVIVPYPETAPGGFLDVHAHFAGKPIARVTDFRVCKGEFDSVGAPIPVFGSTITLPDSISFICQIPDTMLDSVMEHLRTGPSYNPDFDPVIEALKTKNIGALVHLDSSQTASVLGFITNVYLKCRFMFTVSSADGESLKIRKDFMVRYNCLFQNNFPDAAITQRLPVNHNPGLQSLVLYQVTGDTSDFDPADPGRPYTMTSLERTQPSGAAMADTIEIDTGRSYFIEAPINNVDFYHIPYPVGNDPSKVKDSLVAEKFTYSWFYEQQGASSDEDAMTLQQGEHEETVKLYPPLDPNVLGGTIWVKVSDYLDSKTPRPTGSAQTSVRCVFRYTDAYRRAMGR